jgi:hypothetical protein
MLNKVYWTLGSGILLLYGLSGIFGWELGGHEGRHVVPAAQRGQPGWARSSHFWVYSGYRGGK